MSAPTVDVLATLDRAIARNRERGSAIGSPSDKELRATRDAVAELIENVNSLVKAGKRFRNTVVETRGVRGMDEHDAAISAVEVALARVGAAP